MKESGAKQRRDQRRDAASPLALVPSAPAVQPSTIEYPKVIPFELLQERVAQIEQERQRARQDAELRLEQDARARERRWVESARQWLISVVPQLNDAKEWCERLETGVDLPVKTVLEDCPARFKMDYLRMATEEMGYPFTFSPHPLHPDTVVCRRTDAK